MNHVYETCIRDCLNCYRTCFEQAMRHCLEMGEAHVAPAHFRTMMNCADICQIAARLAMSRSPHAASLCRVCAQVCADCVQSCEAVGEMEARVEACRRCAASCQEMIAA